MDRESWIVIGVGVTLLGILLPFNLYLMNSNAKTLKDHFNQLINRLEARMTLLEQNQQAAVARLEQNQHAIALLEQSQQATVARLEQSQQAAVAQLEDRIDRLEQSQQRATEKMERSLETQRQELQAIGERTARIEGALTGPWDARNGERMLSARVSHES